MRDLRIFLIGLFATGVLVACSPTIGTQEAMMDDEPAVTMMETMTDASQEPMMDTTTTPDTMHEDDLMGNPEMMEETSPSGSMESTADPMMGTGTPQDDMQDEMSDMDPAWFDTQLTDGASGETFQMRDFEGKVVLVETFAQWCPTCLSQQREMAKLPAMVGMPDDLVIVSLDVDPNEDASMLAKYLERHGFDWRFAIAPPEVSREIGSLYGSQFLNPPSAPVFVIDRHGTVHPLPFGLKSADDLANALKPFLDEGM